MILILHVVLTGLLAEVLGREQLQTAPLPPPIMTSTPTAARPRVISFEEEVALSYIEIYPTNC